MSRKSKNSTTLSGTVIILADVNSDRVTIEVTDAASHCVAVEITLKSADVANALFHRYVPCSFALNESGVLGATVENKTELVPAIECGDHFKAEKVGFRTNAAVAALAPFEVDGWMGEARDLFNRHNVVRRDGAYLVRFFRYVRDGKPVKPRD